MERYSVKSFPIEGSEDAKSGITQADRLFQHRLEHRREIARRGVDDGRDLGGRNLLCNGLVSLRSELVSLGVTLSKLTLEIGDGLLRIGYCVVRRRTHLRTSSGPSYRPDHTVIGAAYHVILLRRRVVASANSIVSAERRESALNRHSPAAPRGSQMRRLC